MSASSWDAPAIVVGAGVVGLAVARALALAGHPPWVLEAEAAFGTQTSARNSEVLHAGLYYPPGSLKARLCLHGAALAAEFCAARGVPHRWPGKLIVAQDDAEEAGLQALAAQALACGAARLQPLDARQLRALEPELKARSALWSPRTGIVDAHALMLALLGEAQAHGAELVTRARVQAVARDGSGFRVRALSPEGEVGLRTPRLVNAAGHGAVALARRIEGLPPGSLPAAHLAKGSYFSLRGRAPFARLVYPAPGASGHLGIHLTLDLAGQARFGPDLQWVADPQDLAVDPQRRAVFAEAIGRYWPGLDPSRLQPAHAGLRPKISGPGEPAADFRIDGPQVHGVAGLVNLMGIESPGLTSALAIAEEVQRQLDAALD